MVDVGSIKLSNGVQFPSFGLGTWLSTEPEQLKEALRAAFDAGYRYVDTAFIYRNEAVVGEVLQEYYDAGKFKRSDIFLTTKLPFFGHRQPEKFLQASLKNLRTDYIDLYLMHSPLPFKLADDGENAVKDADEKFVVDLVPLADTWSYIESEYAKGVLKSVGLSNFNSAQIQDIYEHAKVKPHNLQIELHILFRQRELVELCEKLNISITAYGPLGSPGSKDVRGGPKGDCLNNPLVMELSKKYNKTPAQILLRHLLQCGYSVIPKSTNPKRVRENIDIFDFKISAPDMKRFDDEIKEEVRLFPFNFATHHPWFPFEKKQ